MTEPLRGARRILVVGPSGAGKTRLSIALGRALGLPVVHLDRYRWRAGWVALGDAEWRAVVAELVREPAWVMDGTYESTLDLRVPASEAVVVLERPRVLCLLGLARRRFVERGPRPDAPPGQKLDRAFLSYLWRYPRVTRPLLAAALREHGADKPVVVLRRRTDAARLLGLYASRNRSTR